MRKKLLSLLEVLKILSKKAWLINFLIIFLLISEAFANSLENDIHEIIDFVENSAKCGQFVSEKYLDPTCDLIIRFQESFENIEIPRGEYFITCAYKQKNKSDWMPILLADTDRTRRIRFRSHRDLREIEESEERLRLELNEMRERRIINLLDGQYSSRFREIRNVIYINTNEEDLREVNSREGELIYIMYLDGIKVYETENNRDEENDIREITIIPKNDDQIKMEIYQLVALSDLRQFNAHYVRKKEKIFTLRSFGWNPKLTGLATFKTKLHKKIKLESVISAPYKGLCVNIYFDYRSSPDKNLWTSFKEYFLKYVGLHIGYIETGSGEKNFGSIGLAISIPSLRRYFSLVLGYGNKEKWNVGIALNSALLTDFLDSVL